MEQLLNRKKTMIKLYNLSNGYTLQVFTNSGRSLGAYSCLLFKETDDKPELVNSFKSISDLDGLIHKDILNNILADNGKDIKANKNKHPYQLISELIGLLDRRVNFYDTIRLYPKEKIKILIGLFDKKVNKIITKINQTNVLNPIPFVVGDSDSSNWLKERLISGDFNKNATIKGNFENTNMSSNSDDEEDTVIDDYKGFEYDDEDDDKNTPTVSLDEFTLPADVENIINNIDPNIYSINPY